MYKCPFCRKKYKNISELKRHISLVHDLIMLDPVETELLLLMTKMKDFTISDLVDATSYNFDFIRKKMKRLLNFGIIKKDKELLGLYHINDYYLIVVPSVIISSNNSSPYQMSTKEKTKE